MKEPGPVKRFAALLRALVFFFSTFGMVAVAGLSVVPLALWLKKPLWIKGACRWWVRLCLPLLGVRIRLENASFLETNRAIIFVPNHQSFLDIPIMMGWVRWPSFLSKIEIAHWPLFGPCMRLLNCVFVDRTDRRSRLETAGKVRAKMAQGVDFCIYPEGTRSVDGKLQPFRSGAFHLAVETHALLVPVYIDGSGRILNKRGMRMYPGVINVRLLDSIDCSLADNRDSRELLRRVEKLFQETVG